jgi:hypothetical protein
MSNPLFPYSLLPSSLFFFPFLPFLILISISSSLPLFPFLLFQFKVCKLMTLFVLIWRGGMVGVESFCFVVKKEASDRELILLFVSLKADIL